MSPNVTISKKDRSLSKLKKRKRSSSGTGKQSNKVVNDTLKDLLTGETDDIPTIPPSQDTDGGTGNNPTEVIEQKTTTTTMDDDENNDSKEQSEKEALSIPKKTSSPSMIWAKELSAAHGKKVKVTVILERANLETIKHSRSSNGSGGLVLLNSDDHQHHLRKTGRDANDARPDITHQCLLALQDSPLNKAGHLKVYIRTARNVLIDVHPQTRIPRTMKRFSGLMAELLEKFKVRGTNGATPLLKVIRNPVTSHLPVGARKIVCTYNTENTVDARDHAMKMSRLALPDGKEVEKVGEEEMEINGKDVHVVYVIGAMAHGKVTEDWADDYICMSEYPLSAATVCSRILYAYESMLGIM